MVRYKGRPSAKTIAKTHPFCVELEAGGRIGQKDIRDNGLVPRAGGLKPMAGAGSCRAGVWFVRECFAVREDAEAFAKQFGGHFQTTRRPINSTHV